MGSTQASLLTSPDTPVVSRNWQRGHTVPGRHEGYINSSTALQHGSVLHWLQRGQRTRCSPDSGVQAKRTQQPTQPKDWSPRRTACSVEPAREKDALRAWSRSSRPPVQASRTAK